MEGNDHVIKLTFYTCSPAKGQDSSGSNLYVQRPSSLHSSDLPASTANAVRSTPLFASFLVFIYANTNNEARLVPLRHFGFLPLGLPCRCLS